MHVQNDIKQSRKRGFGIMEVMVAALVLGLLYAAICQLQKGNRDALLRIRGRDGATEVAQNVIDDLSSKGLASFAESCAFGSYAEMSLSSFLRSRAAASVP